MIDVVEALNLVKEVYVRLPKRRVTVVDELRKIELEESDILHALELGRLDAIASTQLDKDLKRVLRERRSLKEELEILQEIQRFVRMKTQSEHAINTTIGNIKSIKRKQKGRVYTMRVRPDLQPLVDENREDKLKWK